MLIKGNFNNDLHHLFIVLLRVYQHYVLSNNTLNAVALRLLNSYFNSYLLNIIVLVRQLKAIYTITNCMFCFCSVRINRCIETKHNYICSIWHLNKASLYLTYLHSIYLCIY